MSGMRGQRRKRKVITPASARPNHRLAARLFGGERLEERRLLTADPVFHTNVEFLDGGGAAPAGAAGPVGFTPTQIRQAYGFNQILFNGTIQGDGTGQTIAIVDAYDDPNIATDLATFDSTLHIPAPPSFTRVSQTGSTTSYPVTDPKGKGTNNWEVEEALDVEWSHALAPGASIVLVEANDNVYSNLINTAAKYAAGLSGVSVVSMSFGSGELSSETTSNDPNLMTPNGHAGVTFVASTGDGGSPGEYPAFSPNVLAVGGTSLTLNGSNKITAETGWSGSGGGVSTMEKQPAFQNAVDSQAGNGTTWRTIPDVSFDADPGTGVAICDSYNNSPSAPWVRIGGTSVSAPCWAALIADADQGRALAGLPLLDGPSRTLPAIYGLPYTTDFNDIIGGSNGAFTAKAGYDLVTGLGSPVANMVAAGLVGQSTVSGEVFSDINGNGILDNGEAGLQGWTVYEDLNNNGVDDPTTINTVNSTDVPKSMPASSTATSNDVVSGLTANIESVTVTINLSQLNDSNLVISLISPTGAVVALANNVGGNSGNSFTNTTFDDAATFPIGSGTGSFTGTFEPSAPLAALYGSNPNGTWQLQVVNSGPGFTSTLNSWSMRFTTGDPTTTSSATGAYQITNPIAGTYRVREILQSPYTEIAPAAGFYGATMLTGATLSGENFANELPVSTAPTSINLLSSSDTGISNSDGITNLNNSSVSSELQFSVAGTIAGALVSVYSDGNLIGTATAAGTTTTVTTNGTATIADGTHTITAQQTQSGHADSPNSSPLTVQIRATPPTQTITSVTPNPRTSPVSQMTIVFSEPVLGFDLTDLTLSLNGGGNLLTGSQTLTSSDHITWTLGNLNTITGTSGSYVLNQTLAGATISDAAGNIDQTTSSASFTVNPVAAPTSVSLPATSDTGVYDFDRLTNLNNSSPSAALQFSVAGTIVGTLVSVYSDGTLIGTATATDTTTLVTTDGVTTLTDGTHTITATQTPAGQTPSASSSSLLIRIDTAPPTQSITSVSPNPSTDPVDQITIVFSKAVYGFDPSDLTLSLDGGPDLLTDDQNLFTGDHITWFLGNLSPIAGTAGTYVLSLTLDGTTITDTAGNIDQTTSSTSFTIIPVAAPTSVSLVPATDTGISNSDGITNLNNSSVSSELQFSVAGTIAGDTVSVYSDGNLIGTATADDTKTIITTDGVTALADGIHDITATQTPDGQSPSASSNALAIQVDTAPPTQMITSVTPNPRTSPVSQMTIVFSEPVFGLSLTDLTLALNGGGNLLTGSQTLTTSDHITWTLGNLNSITGTSGNYLLNQTLAGTTITDTAGNADQTTSSTSFTVNPVAAPTSVSLLAASDTGISNSDGITNLNNSSPAAELQFSVAGTISGALVSLYSDGNLIGTATASGATTVVTTDGVTTLADGAHGITARQSPSGQSPSAVSNSLTIQVDTAAPTQTLTSVSPNPRTSPVPQMTIVFSEPVIGLDLTDLTLTRNGGGNLLTGSQTLATSDYVTWTLGNLTPLTGTAGNYVLNLTLAGTTITDTAGNADQTTSSSGFTVNASIVSQALFYDNSKFNKNVEGVAAGTTDDKAIDPSKSAYLAGSGTATFANISAFVDGINGVMVDIAGEPGVLTAGDFTFRVGLNNSPSQWGMAPTPSTVSVRAGAGTRGSDRVEITWTDGSIAQEWLEVTVNANANTGLATPYTFFYGSVIANSGTGDTGALAITSSTDENAARSHTGTATVSNIFDYNKDGFVNSSDENAARGAGATIKFIKIASNTPLAPDASPTVTPVVTASPATTALPAMKSAPAATPALPAQPTLNQAGIASVSAGGAHPTVVGNQGWTTTGALTSKSIQATADEFWHVVDDSLLELLAIARRQATLRRT